MHIALLFPPGWRYLNQPFLSLPSLAAYLRPRGVSVSQRDLNLEFMEHLSTEQGIEPVHARVVDKFQALEKAAHLDGIEQRFYANLAWAALSSPGQLAAEIRHARQTTKGEGFYDTVPCIHAVQLLFLTWDLLWSVMGDPHNPASVIVSYLEDSLQETMAVVRDDRRNPFVEYSRDVVVPSTLAQKPDAVGISVSVVSQLIPALTLARFFRKADDRLPIIFGGGVCTRLSHIWPTHPELFDYLDHVILFEGEQPLLRLVEALDSGRELDRVPNLVYRKDGAIRGNPIEPPEPIDALPTPDFDGLPLERYQTPQVILPMLSSRGCYWGKCRFCDFHRTYTGYRRRDPDLVLQDIQTLVSRYGVGYVHFSDEAVAPHTLARVSDGLIASGLKIKWDALARFERQFTREFCQKLAQAGCVELDFGLETASERISVMMRKGVDNETALQVLRNVSRAGIVTRVNVIFGFPTETKEEAWETIHFVVDNSDVIDAVVSQPFRLERLAPLSLEADKYGIRILPDDGKDLAFTHYHWEAESGFSAGEGAEMDRQLWREVGKRFPRFSINFLQDVPTHYSRHGSKAQIVREVQASVERYRKDSVVGTLSDVQLDNGYKPRLREGVMCGRLHFDLSKIDISINNGLVLFQNVAAAPPLQATEADVVVNVREPGRVLRVTPFAAEVFRHADGTRTVSGIAQAIASRMNLREAQALESCLGVLKLYRMLLDGTGKEEHLCIPS